MEQDTCNCPDPALCAKLKRHINGRLWDIWNGRNITPRMAQQYRNLWLTQAGERPEVEQQPTTFRQPCNCGHNADARVK